MKRLCILCCLILVIGQIVCQSASASSPIINAPCIGQITDSVIDKLGHITSSKSFGKINNSQPLLSFMGKAAVLTGNMEMEKIGMVAESNSLNLEGGNVLISPEKDILLNTQEGTISIASGAAIFIIKSGMNIVIYDLYQARPNQVSVVVNKHKLMMGSGCMLVLTKQKIQSFEDLDVDCHSIKYYKAREINFEESSGNAEGNTVNVFVANFSITSAIGRIQPLRQLIDSKDKHDQLLLQKLLKSAAMFKIKQDVRRSDHV